MELEKKVPGSELPAPASLVLHPKRRGTKHGCQPAPSLGCWCSHHKKVPPPRDRRLPPSGEHTEELLGLLLLCQRAAVQICLRAGTSAAVLPHSCQRVESQGHVPAPYRSQLPSQMGGRRAIQSYLARTFVAYFQLLSPPFLASDLTN